MTAIDEVLSRIDDWGADHAAAVVVGPAAIVAAHGDDDHVFAWASVTKLATALTVLIAAERGLLDLDDPAGPAGSTVRHLLAHASGLPFDGSEPIVPPGRRRIYSNPGFDMLGALVAERAGITFEAAISAWLLQPLGMTRTSLRDRPSRGLDGPRDDLAALARECLRPTLISDMTHALATTVVFPGLAGLLPGVGRFDPLDWGLGFELHDGKAPHWMGERNSAAAFGHFGGSGTFLWVDPAADIAFVVLTDLDYGPWALQAWPWLSDAVLEAAAG